jgi:hypothetical protein
MSDTDGPGICKVLTETVPDAAVITCSDPRFQAAFREFIEVKLGLALETYIP